MANTKVTGDLIANGTLTATNLADSAVTTDKLANSSVTAAKLNSITTDNISEGTNLFYTDARVGTYLSGNGYDTATNIIAAITDSAPTTLDTLNELAAALGDDPNFATTVTNSIATKLPLAGGTISGNLTVSGSLTGTLATAAQPNVTSVGTLSSLAVSGNLQVDTDTLYVDSPNNRVGIGTASPSSKLDILRSSSDRTTLSTVLSVSSQGNGPYTGFGGKISFKSNIYYGSATGAPDGIIETAYIGAVMASNYKNDSDLVFGTRQSATTVDEKMRITSSGNVGIGTTSPSSKLDIRGSGTLLSTISSNSTDGASVFYAINDSSKSCELGVWGSTRTAFGAISANNGYVFSADDLAIGSVSNVKFGTGSSNIERMRIDSSGNVGIGTSSPYQKTVINGHLGFTTGTAATDFTADIKRNGIGWQATSGDGNLAAFINAINTPNWGADLTFYTRLNTSGAINERMRITSGGDIEIKESVKFTSVGTSHYAQPSTTLSTITNGTKFQLYSDGTSYDGQIGIGDASNMWFKSQGVNDAGIFQFYGGANAQLNLRINTDGSTQNRTGVWGASLSDLRLKENIVDASNKLENILSLKVKNFNYIGEPEKLIGFVAQEFEEVFPSLVTTYDSREYDEDGNVIKGLEDQKGLKVGMDFAILTKAIQELKEIVDNQQRQINDLKAQLNG